MGLSSASTKETSFTCSHWSIPREVSHLLSSPLALRELPPHPQPGHIWGHVGGVEEAVPVVSTAVSPQITTTAVWFARR